MLLNHKIKDSLLLCQVCEKVFVEETQWQAHLKGAKHMKALKKKKKIADNAQSQENQLTSS